MSGGTMSGYWAIGRPVIATKPRRTVRMEMTMATMGRSMKKRAMASPRSRSAGGGGMISGGACRFRGRLFLRLHARPRFDAREALDDDALAGRQARFDDPQGPHPLPRLHGADLGLVAGADDRYLIAPLELVDRPLRHQHRPLFDLRHGAHLGVLAGAQEVAGVGADGDGLDGPRLDVHLAALEEHPALVGEDRAVPEHQLEVGLLRGLGVLPQPLLEAHVFLLGERVEDADGVALGDGGEDRR